MGTELMQRENMDISNIDTTNFNALLSLLHGKNDSICKIFNKEIKVDVPQLKILDKMMCDKLMTHNVNAVTTNIDITFLNKQILHFKSWPEFELYDFKTINSATKSIFLQWDFFVKLDGYQVPQRHTVSVRISSSPKPSDMFKVLLSGGFDESSDIDIQGSTMICKVDFINNTLAEELINIVAKWDDLCESAVKDKGRVSHWLYKNKSKIANIGETSTILLFCSVVAVILKLVVFPAITSITYASLIFSLLFSLPVFSLFRDIGRNFGKRLFEKFGNIMELHVFNITLGDTKYIEKIKKDGDCRKECFWFIANTLLSIIISVVFFLI